MMLKCEAMHTKNPQIKTNFKKQITKTRKTKRSLQLFLFCVLLKQLLKQSNKYHITSV